MLQRIRDGLHGRKWLAWFALAPIALIFVFWGGSSSLDFSGVASKDAAKVNGESIPAAKATNAWSQAQARWSQQNSAEIPADQQTRIKETILDELVTNELWEQRLKKENYRVSESQVLSAFEKVPEFQTEGKYDAMQARRVLQLNGTNEFEFFDDMRRELMKGQLQQGIAGSNFLTRAETQRFSNLQNEEREVEYARVDAGQFTGSEPIDDAAIKAYYEKNGDRFMTMESVSLEYAEMRVEQLAAQVTPTDEDLRKLYEANRAMYVQDEMRRARPKRFHSRARVVQERDEAEIQDREEHGGMGAV